MTFDSLRDFLAALDDYGQLLSWPTVIAAECRGQRTYRTGVHALPPERISCRGVALPDTDLARDRCGNLGDFAVERGVS
jgi:hypothetical protein